MKKKVLLPSILVIVLCMGLIAGATFALFGKSSEVNIAVNSAKVEFVSSIEEDSLKLYSLKEISLSENAVDEYELQSDTFLNKGTAVISGDSLVINNMSPGDKVEFVISVKNYSTITAKYRTRVRSEDDQGLYKYLVATFDGAPSDWQIVEPEADPSNPEAKLVKVSIELPKTVQDAAGLSTRLVFSVEAVQGNAVVPSSVSTVDELAAALANEEVQTIELAAGIYDLTDSYYLDGYGFCIDRPVEIKGEGESTVLQVGSSDTAISGQAYFFITADNVTISDMTIESVQTGATYKDNYNTMKISSLNETDVIVSGTTLRNVTFTGVTNNHIDVNGAKDVLFENVVFGDAGSVAYKCAVSVANSSDVTFLNSSIGEGAWGSVGVMYKAGSNGSLVTFVNCEIAGTVYTEYPESGNDINTVNGLDDWVIVVEDYPNGGVYQKHYVNSVLTVSSAEELLYALSIDGVKVINLEAGEYEIFDNEPYASFYGIEIDHPVTLVGAGMDQTVIRMGDGKKAISGQAYFYIRSNDVTISDLTFESAQTGASTKELYDLVKVSLLPEGVDNVIFDSVAFTGTTNNYLNLHCTENVTIKNCVIGEVNGAAYKCALAIAASLNVQIADTSIAGGAWGSVGLMYDPNNATEYPYGSEVMFSNCEIASVVYTERGEEKIHTVTGLDDWVFVEGTESDEYGIYKDAYINPVATVNSFEELAIALNTDVINTVVLGDDIVWSVPLTVKEGVTLLGNGHTITITEEAVSAKGVHVCMNVNGTVDGVKFDLKYDNTTQHGAVSVLMPYSNAIIRNCVFTGTYNMGDVETTRGIESASGADSVLIENNEFYNLRQPAYLNSATNGVVKGNMVDETRGFCVQNDGWAFSGNTFINTTSGDEEVCDICFFNTTTQLSDDEYCKISTDNGGCYVQDQHGASQEEWSNYIGGVKVEVVG